MTIVQNEKGYDVILLLMSLDVAYEKETGVRMIEQEWFDQQLAKVGFDTSYLEKEKSAELEEYYFNRLEFIIKSLKEKIESE